jgi:ABC-type dipeptide/oligopeptide/nickel transport system permease component
VVSQVPKAGSGAPGAISNRDYALAQGCLLLIGLTYVLVKLRMRG